MYIGSWDGYEYAVDVHTGQQLWASFLGISQQKKRCYGGYGIGIQSTAAVENNVVYVGGGDGYMYALNTADGSILWKTLLGLPPYYNWSSPLLYNNALYIGLAAYCDPPFVQGKVMALSMTDGSIVASISLVPGKQTGATVWGSAAVDASSNTIYVATGNNGSKPLLKQPNAEAIVALDANTLAVKDHWQIPTTEQVHDSDFGSTPVLFAINGVNYIGALNKNGIYYVLNRDNLSAGPVWEHSLSSNSEKVTGDNISSSCYNNGVIYAGAAGGSNNGLSFGGSVTAFDATSGTILWTFQTQGAMVSPVTCTSDLVFDNQGKTVEVRDASNGNILFSYKTGARLFGASVISNGALYVPSSDGNVYAFSLPQ
jgi:outer membrane protein assembly factor BamB